MALMSSTAARDGREIAVVGATGNPSFQKAQTRVNALQIHDGLAARLCPAAGAIVVGANIVLSASTPDDVVSGAILRAVEAVPATFQDLRENLSAQARGNVTPHRIAMWEAEGAVAFQESDDRRARHRVVPEHIVGDASHDAPVEVRSRSLDGFVIEQDRKRVSSAKEGREGFEIDGLDSRTAITLPDIDPCKSVEAFRRLMPHACRSNPTKSFRRSMPIDRSRPTDMATFMADRLLKHAYADASIRCADQTC